MNNSETVYFSEHNNFTHVYNIISVFEFGFILFIALDK